ncbi:MAG: DUF721 domain-containing protein [Gammaproteobacteria bacterium]
MMIDRQKQYLKTPDIGTLLTGKSSDIHSLYRHAQKLINVQKTLNDTLPSPLNEHVTVANLVNDTLTIYTDSAAWAARLRFTIPDMLKSLRQNDKYTSVKTIRIKVQPHEKKPQPSRSFQKLSISTDTAILLKHVADTIDDPELRESLLKLSRNQ